MTLAVTFFSNLKLTAFFIYFFAVTFFAAFYFYCHFFKLPFSVTFSRHLSYYFFPLLHFSVIFFFFPCSFFVFFCQLFLLLFSCHNFPTLFPEIFSLLFQSICNSATWINFPRHLKPLKLLPVLVLICH